MKSTRYTSALIALFLTFAGPSAAKEAPQSKTTLSGQIVTVGHYRNDTDFDATERFDDVDGQTDAQIATFFAPHLRIEAGQGIEVHYELELGWNAWSRNNPGAPNQFLPSDDASISGPNSGFDEGPRVAPAAAPSSVAATCTTGLTP